MTVNKVTTTGYDPHYHDRQFASPYQSTISFCDWLVELGAIWGGAQQDLRFGMWEGSESLLHGKAVSAL